MSSAPPPTAASCAADSILAQVRTLYDAGQLLQAWQVGQALGPLQQWPSPEGRLLAGRLAWQLSATRLGDAIVLRAWRTGPRTPELELYGAMALHSVRGPLAALDRLRDCGLLDNDQPIGDDARAYAAWLHATLRDFETADALIDQACAHSDSGWVWSQRSAIHELADRYGLALEAARHAMALNPALRSPIQIAARLQSYALQDTQAIDLLREAMTRLQSPRLAAQLASLQIETGQYLDALATLARCETWAPLPDRQFSAWLAGRRCDIHSRLGNSQLALTQARQAGPGFYAQVAQRLAQAPADARRVMLPVGFVHQHHMTCAPATMAALTRYWQHDTDHLALAESICYDGTPHHSQRRWAQDHGWFVREFTVSWDSARALVDAGIPFALSTVHPGSAHLQAVIGYDNARGTLLVRDPSERMHTEFAEGTFFDGYRASGPRGMAMVPSAQRALLEALTLPEAPLHDLAHAMQDALVGHDRARAATHCAELAAQAPGHRLEIDARRTLANYDGDLPGELRCVDELLALYPQDVNLRLSKAALLRQLASHDDYLGYLRAACAPAQSHPLLHLRLVRQLLDDARARDETQRILRALVRSWCRADTLDALAVSHWDDADYARAVDLYRLASTLDETNEGQARAYFRAARMVRDEARALAYLRHRVERLGALSAQPAMTLHDCLDDLNRDAEARAVIADALSRHPDDGALLLFAARLAASDGQIEQADALLERARGRNHEADWLRAAARMHQMRGRPNRALEHWEQVAALQPLDIAAQRAVATLRDELHGRSDAVDYLRTLSQRFPHHQGLCELLAEWLDEAPLQEQERALHRLLELHPVNAWAQRQLGLILGRQRRFVDAHARMAQAHALAPHSAAWHNVHGDILLLEGRRNDARAQFRLALGLSIDNEFALDALLKACVNIDERQTELDFVLDEIKRQVIYGDCLLSYQRLARDTIAPDQLAQRLEQARQARPDLWQAWAACIRQQLELGQIDAARDLCQQALGRFQMLPRMHVEHAEIERLAGDRTAERAALLEALRLNPGWGLAARRLADVYEAEGDFQASRTVLETALHHAPGDEVLHGYLGHALWQLDEREAALRHFQQAAALDPGYHWAWRMLKLRGAALDQPQAALALARRLVEQRPGEPKVWVALARTADEPEEKLAALDQALRLSPLALEPHELKLDLLILLKRHDEALALVDHGPWGPHAPVALQARACTVLAEKGQLDAAIARMTRVLDADPNHHAGWELLAEWHSQREDWPAYLTAVRQMHRITPNDARTLGYLADALSRAEPRTDVRPYLRRALHLSPGYSYAGQKLFDLEFEAGDLDAAEAALRALRAHGDNGYTRWRSIRLATQRREHKSALDQYWRMWAMHDDDLTPFRDALQLLIDAGWADDAQRVIDRVVLEPEANPHIGTLWVQRRAGRLPASTRYAGFEQVLANGRIGQYAAQELIEQHRQARDVAALRRLVQRHGDALRSDDITYGQVGYALVDVHRPRDAMAWFGDWREHPDAPPWALLNLVSALRDLGHNALATEVSRHAMTLPPDHTHAKHALWLAADAALAGDIGDASRLLAKVQDTELNNYYRFLARLVTAQCALGPAGQPLDDDAYASAVQPLRGLSRLLPSFIEREPALRRYTGRALWRIARARGHHQLARIGSCLYLALVMLS